MFDTRTRLSFFCLPKSCSRSRLKKLASAPDSDQQKICSCSVATLTVVAPGGYGSATLVKSHN